MKHYLHIFSFLFFAFLGSHSTSAQINTIELATTTVVATTVAEDLHVPWEILWGPDDWIWMTERNCGVSRINPETGEQIHLLEIGDCHEQQESGLLGMAVHPDFQVNPWVFLVYTYLEGFSIEEKIVRYVYDANAQTLTEDMVLLDGIQGNTTHDGSRIIILPDLTILMSTGDAQNQAASQDIDALTGKFLRMNMDGTVPADNPIPGSLTYSYGHRNAQGLVMASNGIIYSSEHGPTNDDEFNIILPNRNYGWPTVQGFCNTPSEMNFCNMNDVVEPLAAWTPTLAVSGIDYFDHESIPEWQNSVLMCNLKARDLRLLRLNETGDEVIEEVVYLDEVYGRFRDICIAPDGRIFLSTSNQDAYGTPTAGDDKIIQLQGFQGTPPPIALFEADATEVCSGSTVTFTDLSQFEPTSWLWEFQGGTPPTSTDANPVVFYENIGTYSVILNVDNANGGDTATQFDYITVADLTGIEVPYTQNFSLIPSEWEIVNGGDDGAQWAWAGAGSCSGTAYAMNNFDIDTRGTEDVFSSTFDLSGYTNCTLTFDVAYARYNNDFFEGLQIEARPCSGSPSIVYDKEGTDLATAADTEASFVPAGCSEWRTETVDLSSVSDQLVTLSFINIGGWGNLLYVDNIDIQGFAVGIENANLIQRFYPNPVNDKFIIEWGAASVEKLQIQLFDLNGKVAFAQNAHPTGTRMELNLAAIPAGVYLLKVIQGDKVSVEKVVVE